MRLLNKIKVSVFIFILSLSLSSAQASSDDLVGTWKIVDYQFYPDPVELLMNAGVTEEQISVAEADIASSMQLIMDNSEMTYNADGSYVGSSIDEESNEIEEDTGSWALSEDGKTLIDSPDEGEKRTYEILFLSPNTFVFKVTDDDMDVSFVLEKQ